MKKTTFLKIVLLIFVFLQHFNSYSQNYIPFAPRYNQDIKGDMLLIGNSILNRAPNPNTVYNGSDYNSNFSMQFINIDNGATPGVFNSSSANLVVPNSNKPNTPCFKIRYAALYWGAVTRGAAPITNVKFKMPTGGYNDVTGTVIYNAGAAVIGTSKPYACFADVTSLVTSAANANPEGTYTLANVSSAVGSNGGTGLSAGWSLFIVYEDPKLPTKSITSFDGFSAISATSNLDIPVSGFRTIPTGPVRAKFAFAALEGDRGISGDYLAINATRITATNGGGTVLRSNNNFFNSSVTHVDPVTLQTENYLNRNPASTNTLGYDSGVFEINNNGNTIIKNNDQSAVISLRSTQDVYFYYFNAIALDIIAPNIVLTKTVTDVNNVDIGNTDVALGTELFYNVGFQNIGNDNAVNFTIKDELPININFDPANIIVPNGSGITYVYTPATRTIVFTIPNNLVEKNDPRYVIKFKVKVVDNCNDLSDACSNAIQNKAFAYYRGQVSNAIVDDQLSLATFDQCYIGTPSPTNFLVGLENCVYTKNYELCGANVVLTAANGYNAYSWSTSSTGTPVIGTTQSITVSNTGTYYVTNTALAPCRSIKQVVTVVPSGTTTVNPINPFADSVVTCPNNGKDLPKIFLCGANSSRLLNIGVSDATSIIWQKLDEGSCTAIGIADCANESASCTWNQVGMGNSFTANASGQFRVVLNYAGGCFNIYYFNVFKNLLNPTATSRDIICNTIGEITVGGVPSAGYEFSLTTTGPWQDSNVFPITTANTYTVYIRQKVATTNPCLFSVPNINILRRNFTVSPIVLQPLCNSDKGSIKLAANDVRGQYFYSISSGGTVVNFVGPIAASDFTFDNLSAGSYTYEVRTEDGCLGTGSFQITSPAVLSATVNQTKPITCETGEITVYPIGGTMPYSFYVNGSTSAQYDPVINTPTAGTYTVEIIDFNGCRTTTAITVAAVPKPVYNTTGTNVNCYGDASGVINFNVTNTNGYTVTYSINDGVTYGSSGIISNLTPGTYNTILKYTLNGVECLDTMKPITITQPATALTASAGVSELAGCGPGREGRIRITNPQGGVTPYTYSFDNQATWISDNQAYKIPGTYTVYIKDANGCIFPMPGITIDPEPQAPVINVDTPVDFNCDGTATSTVTITNPASASFTYNYYLDGVLNTNTANPNVFLNVAPGTHNVKVEYNLTAVPTFSNLLYETFGYGDDTTSPGINSTYYCFERQVAATQCRGNPAINDGDYSVTSRIQFPFGAWLQPGDHTAPTVPPTAKGRFMVVNIGATIPATEILYEKVINDIIPYQPINVEFYAFNLLNSTNTQFDPDLRVALVDSGGNEISFYNTGNIPKSQQWEYYPKTSQTLNPGNNTTLKFIVRSNVRQTSGNDVAFDDIKVFQLPKSCVTEKLLTVVVPDGKAFTATITGHKNVSCAGQTNGEITIAAQNFNTTTGYQYSVNNGVNWITTTTSPVTITGLAAATYNVLVRYDASATGVCAYTLPQIITAPAALVTTATITKPATCTTGAEITATSTGGTLAYRYELWDATNTTPLSPSQNTGIFTNVLAPGSYYIRGYDANNCSDSTDAAIVVTAPPALTAALSTATDYCYTTANPATLDVTVTGGTGPFTYKLDGNAAISSAFTSYSFSNVAPGTHTIEVTDSNNCTATIDSIDIAPQISFNVSLINDLRCPEDASIGNPVITGGNTGSYTYTVSRDSGTPVVITTMLPFPYTATQAGSYVFTVTDSRGCTASSNPIIVTPRTTPSHLTAKTDISCNGLDNGTIAVTPSGGFTTTYTYAIKLSTATTYTTQTTNQFTSLAAGTYDIKVIDSKGCESTPTQVTIANPAAIVPNATATAFSCSSTNAPQSATITVAPSGGTVGYSYSYDNGATFGSNATLTVNDNGTVQTIRVVVRDANGCLSPMQPIVLAPLNKPTDLTFTNTTVTCTATTTTVTVTATNGVGALTFLITGTTSATAAANFGPVTTTGSAATASFPGLLPGNYTFRVTDANGCYYSEAYTVAAVTPIAVAVNKTSDVLCQGGTTGSGTYTVSGNATVGAYTYTPTTFSTGTLTPSGNVLTLSNAAAGTYTVRVTDTATGCFADGTITINQPAAALTIAGAVATNFNCNNDNAQITVSATGGTTAYGYAAVPATPATVPTIFASSNVVTVDTNNGTILNWVVYVRDANGCTTSTAVTIAGDPAPADPVVTVPNQCSATGSGFTITVTPVMGALGPYTYGISGITGAFQTANTFNVVPGSYTVFVRDRNGCFSTGTAVTVAAQLTAGAAVTKPLDCDPTNPNAIITTTINGGRANYSYVITDSIGNTVASDSGITGPTFTYSPAVAGTYTIVITDANACTTTTSATVDVIADPTVAIASQVNVSCNGGSDGSVTLIGSGGSGGYTYSNNATTGFTSNPTFSGLAAGTYTFYVRDSKLCDTSINVSITEPANALAATVSESPFVCSPSNAPVAGTVSINVTSGTGTAPYTYSFNGGAFTSNNVLTINNTTADAPYTYEVRDALGCTVNGNGTLLRLNNPVIGTITSTRILCQPITATTSTVTVPVNAGTGVGTLSYTIVSGPVTNTSGATTGIFSGLTSGNYVFRVTDANGCYDTESYFVAPVTPIVATATKLTDVDCFGNSTGSIRYTVSGFGTGTYSYTINGVATATGQTAGTFDLTNIGAGTYVVVFTDDVTSCTETTSVTINQPTVLDITLVSNRNANCDIPTSRVTVTAAGGTTPYSYAFVPAGNTPVASDYISSAVRDLNPATPLWDVYVRDANGCPDMIQVPVTSDPIPTVTAAGSGCLGTPGGYTILANNTTPAAGIIAPIRYSINNGASYQTNHDFVVTTAGDYTITMIDGNGCIATAPIVTVAPQLTLNAVLNKDITCNPAPTDAQITLTPTGGVGPFTYTQSPTNGSFAGNVFTTNVPGDYTFTATDTTTGCTYTTTAAIPVTAPIFPVITGVSQTASINCNGDDTAAITIAIDNTQGQSPFVFNVLNTTTGVNYGTQTSGLSAGDYLITVTDAKGCTDTDTITITEPAAITFTTSVTPITCGAGGVSLGTITINPVSGGTPNYTYHVTGVNGYDVQLTNQNGSSAVFQVVNFGLYQVVITDANGCTAFENDILVASPPDDLDISVVPVGPTCVGLGSAEVSIGSMSSITGSGPFHFAVYSPGLTYSAPTTAPWYDEDAIGSKKTTIPNLIPGVTYTFIVHDQFTGCYYFETADVPIPTNSTITVNPLTPANITCVGEADGNVTFTIINPYAVATPVTYQIYNSQSVTPVGSIGSGILPASGTLDVVNFGVLPFGNYFVLVTEDVGATNAGCSISSAPFNITESAIDLTITAQKIKNINCNEDGIIAAFASNGTGPYTYQYLLDTVTAPSAVTAGWVTNTTFATSVPGNYIVYVKDDYGCIKSDDVILLQDAPPTIALPDPICYDGTPFTIDLVTDALASATILPATYKVEPIASLNTVAYQNGSTFTFNAAGTYRLYIKDGNGCVAFVDYTVHPQLELIPTLTKGLECTGTPNATITLNTTGGNPLPTPGNYTYEVNFNSGGFVAATTPYSAVAPGTYEFRVTDVNNVTVCQATATIVLDPIPATIIAAPIVTNVSCNGGNDGTITINVTSGVGPYEYSLFDGVTSTAFQTGNTFTGLVAGTTYVVTVSNDRDCLQPTPPITITEPDPLTATAAAAANTTCSNTTVITVSASQGTPSTVGTGYTYSFNGLAYTSDNTFTVNNGPVAKTTTISVRDANGCTLPLLDVTTPALTPPTNLDFVPTTLPTCPANTATVQVTATGGLGTLAFEILSPASATGNISGATSGEFTLLAPGDYIFQVTDDNGCTYQELYTVNPVTRIAIVGALVNDITCNPANAGTNNGSARFTVSGVAATSTYSYTINSGTPFTGQTSPTIDLTSLGAGTYTVTVTDETTLCEATDAVTITLPDPITFTTAATKVFCTQDISQITVSAVSGGTGVYQYAVLPGGTATPPAMGAYSNNPVLSVDTNLTDLTWDVYVRDANGCVAMQPVTVVSNAAPTIVAPAAQCYTGTPLTVDLSPNTITTTYNSINKTYTLDGSVVAGPIVTLNGPGTYVLGIRDDNGCVATVNYTVVDQLIAGAVLAKDLTCAPTPAATINVNITGGVGPFSYQMFNGVTAVGGITPVTGTTFTANPTTAGIYSFEITDNYTPTCSVTTNTVEVTTPVTPNFTTVFTDATCNAGTDGTITVTPTAGVAPFTFALSGGSVVNNTGDTTGNYSGLPAGSYTVVITDAKGCPSAAAAAAIVIDEPIVVSATISVTTPLSCGTGNVTQAATVTATPFGGNGSYQYNFNNQGWTTDNFYVTSIAGPVNVLVRDTNLCTVSAAASTTIDPLNPPTGMDITGTPIYCVQQGLGDLTSTVTINTVTNGVPPFTYQMVSPTSINNGTSNVFAGLSAGDYLFQVTDANGCTYQELYTVAPRVNIAATVATIANETCFNANDGAATFTVTNSTAYTASLTVVTGSPVITGNTVSVTGLAPGNYTLQVEDTTTGCTSDVSFTIAEITTALDFTSIATNINCNVDTATITVTPTGGTPNYFYAVVPNTAGAPAVSAYGLSNQLTVDTNSGTNMVWDVYVRDVNGCVDLDTVTILTDASPTIPSAVATQCPSATGTYEIAVTASGFSAALEYSADGTNYQTGSLITVNAPGNYTITVRDANGCPSNGFPITILDPLILTPVVTIPVSCTGGDGQISVSTTGGSGNYVYDIDGGGFALVPSFSNLASGPHRITVRDTGTSCEVFVDVNLQAATSITGFDLDKTDVTCYGGNDGRITATMDTPEPGVNDNPVYTYTLTGTTVGGVPVNMGPQPSPLFSGLEASDINGYTVVVTSARGCAETKTVIVDEPGLIMVPAPAVVQFGCTTGNTNNLATITVDPTLITGGLGNYVNYEFIKLGTTNTQLYFGPNNVYTEADLSGGSYIVNVYDDKGCAGTTTTPIAIAPYIALDQVSVAINQAITCTNLEDITVTVSHIGAVAPTNVTYTVEDVIYDNSTTPPTVNKGSAYNLPPVSVAGGVATFTALPVGNYLITVTNTDTGCSVQGVHYVNEPNTFDLTIDTVVDVICLGGTNGSANVTFVDRLITTTPPNGDDAGAFTYAVVDALGTAITNGTTIDKGPITISNLAAGTYTIAATLSITPNCTVTKNFTITGPTAALAITATPTPITCVVGNNDGTISVNATGGWPGGYEFELVAPNPANSIAYGTQNVFTGLTAGPYTVNVRDSKGCIATETVQLVNPSPIVMTASANITLVPCFGYKTAIITAGTPTGGSGTYLYSLVTTYPNGSVTTDGPQLSNQFINLGAGTYQVKVTDSWGCEGILATPLVIAEPAIVTASLVVATTSTCLNPATLTLSVTGGTAPYSYSTFADFASSTAMLSNSVTFQVPVGTYHYYVRDVNDCISYVSNDITIDPIPTLVVSLDLANASINCRGDNSGVIVATAQGGLGNYVYTLLDGSGNAVAFTPTKATPGNFTSLPAGSYTVRVVSGDCNAISTIAQITEPTTSITATPSVTDITCSGSRNGKIEILATGGTGIIKYAISPDFRQFFDSNVFDKLDAGFYDVLVQDENGCIEYLNGIEVKEPSSINATATNITQEICFGDNLGAFNVDIVGGTLPYSVSLIENGTYTAGTATQTQFSFTGLAGGPIKVFIKDANNCTSEITVAMNVPVNLDPIAIVEYGCVSNASTNTVTVTLDSNFTDEANVEYALDGSTTFQSIEVFTNVAPGVHTITARYILNGCEKITMPFTIDAIAPLAIALTDGGLNEIVATTTGGVGGYQYSVNGEDYGSTDKFIIYKTDDYTVTVTDSNGCTTSETKHMDFIEIIIPNVFTPNGDGSNDTWFPMNAENYKDISIYVFDRYGRKLGTFRQGQAWDGTYNGTELPSGDYWYVLKLNNNKDDREFVGNFTLYR